MESLAPAGAGGDLRKHLRCLIRSDGAFGPGCDWRPIAGLGRARTLGSLKVLHLTPHASAP